MGYVMVPVPEEHVEEVMRAILRFTSQARQIPWDEESVAALFRDCDEASKAVLSTASRGVIASGTIGEDNVAQAIEVTTREVSGIVRELNEVSIADSRPPVIQSRMESEVLPNGRVREKRVLWMPTELAVAIRDAERAEFGSDPAAGPSNLG